MADKKRKCLTQNFVESLEPREKPYETYDVGKGSLTGFLVRVQPSGVKTYYYRYHLNGKYSRVRIGYAGDFKRVKDARSIAQEWSTRRARGEDPAAVVRAEKKDARMPTLGEFIAGAYGENVLKHRRSGEATRKRLESEETFGPFLKRRLDDPTWPNAIRNWIREALEDKAAATVGRDLSALKACFAYAVDTEVIETHPLRKVKVPASTAATQRTRYLSYEEEERLFIALAERDAELKAARQRGNDWLQARGKKPRTDISKWAFADYLTPMVKTALYTGLRRRELLHLEWRDIDLRKKVLTVRRETAKADKARHVPLPPAAVAVLSAWRKQRPKRDTFVFPGKNGKPMSHISSAWQKLRERAEVDDLRFHDLRHSYASKLVSSGVDLYRVKELLGHSSIKMTERYSHLRQSDLADSVAQAFGDEPGNVVPMQKRRESTA